MILALILGGCAAKLVRVSLEQRQEQMIADLETLFVNQEPLTAPLTIHQAMARALHYNLESRVKLMETTLAQGVATASRYDMLPRLAANAGYTERDPLPTDTQDLFQTTADLTATWNVLDFGVGYLQSRQKSNRIGIADERRRKAAHNLIRDVRNAFWRAVAADRLQAILRPLMIKVRSALASAREAEEQRLQPPLEILDFQKKLLRTLDQLQNLSRQLSGARVKLAGLINLNPGQKLRLVAPEKKLPIDTGRLADVRILERYALAHRPDLYERDYQRRIKADETRKTLLRLLPGLELSPSRQYDSSGVNINEYWTESSVKLVWNLLNLLAAPANVAMARSQESLEAFRRLALNVTILTQVHIAYRGIIEARDKYETARHLSDVNERLYRHTEAGQQAAAMSEIELIRRDADRILFNTRRDIAYADLQNAVGNLLVSLGVDPLPEDPATDDLNELERAFATFDGTIPGVTVLKKVQGVAGADGPLDPDLASPAWEIEGEKVDPDLATPEWQIEGLYADPDLAVPAWEVEKDYSKPPASKEGAGTNGADARHSGKNGVARPKWEILIIPGKKAPSDGEEGSRDPRVGSKRFFTAREPTVLTRQFSPGPEPLPNALPAAPEGYVIRLGFFTRLEYARELDHWLEQRGHPHFSWYGPANGQPGNHVFAGPYEKLTVARQQALDFQERLKRRVFLYHKEAGKKLRPHSLPPTATDP